MDRRAAFVMTAPLWLWGLLPLWAASGGAIDVCEMVGLFVTGAMTTLVWLLVAVFVAHTKRFSVLGIWFLVALVWIASTRLAASDVPFLVRFRLSEPALRHYAATEDSDPPHYTNAKYVGLCHVQKVWRHGRAVAFSTDSKCFDHVGVIYAPDGLPTEPLPIEVEELSRAEYTHLYGPWYKFEIGD